MKNLEVEVGEGTARVNDFEVTAGECKAEAIRFHIDTEFDHMNSVISANQNKISHHGEEKD